MTDARAIALVEGLIEGNTEDLIEAQHYIYDHDLSWRIRRARGWIADMMERTTNHEETKTNPI